jgi:hypothetical protein
MAKDGKKKKVQSRATPKYTTSSDEGSSSDSEDNLISLFANLRENKKFVKLKNAYAQEVEKCENLSKELSICHDSISSLRNENASLVSKVKDLNGCNDFISCLRDENVRLKAKIEKIKCLQTIYIYC